jgi:AAA15 family ATPase/GTPase
MLKQLKIENFRCFKAFELNHLGRVNLLVGENNSGKTSILEAVNLLCSNNFLDSLLGIMKNRGEYAFENDKSMVSSGGTELLICHLFNQHQIDCGIEFKISDGENKAIIVSVEKNQNQNQNQNNNFFNKKELETNIIAFKKLANQHEQIEIKAGLTYDNSLVLIDDARLYPSQKIDNFSSVQLVMSSSLNTNSTIELFNQVVLTSEENLVYQALKVIEPDIERIAPIILDRRYSSVDSKNGFVVKLVNNQQRIPIGSMGDGIWRILGLTLSLVSAKDGVLLVDEIDTGLHYTALENMWKLIWETAKKLNVQVFATTHNSDCWKALEALTNREDVGEEDISIQRIEKDAPRSVAYNKDEIATAVEREIEVR